MKGRKEKGKSERLKTKDQRLKNQGARTLERENFRA